MKPLRSTFALGIVVAIGGAYLLWNERGVPVAPGAVVLLRAPENEVRRVILQPSNLIIERQSERDAFTVRDPKSGLSAPLDSGEERGLWAQLDLVQSRLPVENPEKPAQYGLENPRASIEIDGRKLEFGAAAPFNRNLIYARGAGRIALVSATLGSTTRKSFNEWRDRNLFGPRVAETGSFGLRNASGQISFERNGSGLWHLSATQNGVFKARADAETIQGALRELSNAKVLRWLDERGQNPARYGLDKPMLAWVSGGLNLQIGARTSGGYAARRDRAGAIFEVPASIPAILNRPLRDWRDFKIAVLDVNATTRIEVVNSNARRTLVKNGEDWGIEGAPSDSEIRAVALDLLDFLNTLHAQNFVDSTKNERAATAEKRFGFDAPILAIETRSGENVTTSVRFGRAQNQIYAQNLSGDNAGSNTVFVLNRDALAPIQNALDKIFPTLKSRPKNDSTSQ